MTRCCAIKTDRVGSVLVKSKFRWPVVLNRTKRVSMSKKRKISNELSFRVAQPKNTGSEQQTMKMNSTTVVMEENVKTIEEKLIIVLEKN